MSREFEMSANCAKTDELENCKFLFQTLVYGSSVLVTFSGYLGRVCNKSEVKAGRFAGKKTIKFNRRRSSGTQKQYSI